jgi:hypothetical protein
MALPIGSRFGRLTVIQSDSGCRATSLCRCDCGIQKSIRNDGLQTGHAQSCGCLRKERAAAGTAKAHLTHGDTAGRKSTTEYASWMGIKSRCLDSESPAYGRYGGRGITMCMEWYMSYSQFLKDMGRKPSPQHSIDRIDNNGNYEPKNCRWATRQQQMRNKRTTIILTFRGETLTLPEWAERTGLGRSTILARIKRYGWSVDSALTIPIMSHAEINKSSLVARWGNTPHP